MTRAGGARGVTRERRGVTLILIALLIVVLVGIVGLSLDFSRYYLYRVELQTTADAAALSGALEIERKSPATAPDSALDYLPGNVVDGGLATMPRAAIIPGTWDFAGSTFTPAASFTTPGINAVKVTATHSAAYTFGQVWIPGNQSLQARATAAVGSVGTTSCLKPWAVAYQAVLNALYPPAGSKPVSYNLTAADIATLSAEGPANQIPLLLSPLDPTGPGNIDAVQVNIPWNGNNSYKSAITGACSDMSIGPGTWLNADPGEGSGQTKNSIKDFCDANGGTTNGNPFLCLGDPKVKLAMWDITNGSTGSNLQFRVKYVGVFAITQFQDQGTNAQITGYFSTMASTGGLTNNPSPLTEAVLVQ